MNESRGLYMLLQITTQVASQRRKRLKQKCEIMTAIQSIILLTFKEDMLFAHNCMKNAM